MRLRSAETQQSRQAEGASVRTIDMVDGWVLRNEQIDPDLTMYAANLLALIASKATPQPQ